MFSIFLLLIITLIVAIYFVPSFIAIGRKHSHVLQITILNTFLGWSFIPWVGALIWATTDHIDTNVKTKGAWIIIGVIFILLISPVLIYSIIPAKYKSDMIQESQYKSVIYTSKSGKIFKQITETKQVKTK